MEYQCAEHGRCIKDIETSKEKSTVTYDAVFGRNGHQGIAQRISKHDDRIDALDIGKRDVDECTRLRQLDLQEADKERQQLAMEFDAKIDRVVDSLNRISEDREKSSKRRLDGKHLLLAILIPNAILIILTVGGWLLGA